MPSVTFDGQSLFVKSRRAWLVGAGMEYSLVPAEEWGRRLDQIRRLGANTVVASAPWIVHEPRPGRFRFDGRADLRSFLEQCAARQLWVVLRIGPSVGEPFDGGGIPSWVIESSASRLRELDPGFLERTSRLYREILGRVVGMQASEALRVGRREVGPVVAVQIEHRWSCANDEQANRYLNELVRFARECGITVPLLTANGLWQPIESAIECWEGCDDLLGNLRQLRSVEPQHPRIALVRDPAAVSIVGGSEQGFLEARRTLPRRVAEALVAGAMPLVADAVGGVHVDRTNGRRIQTATVQGGFISTVEPRGLVVGEHGSFRASAPELRRLLWFASTFGHVFADAAPDYQPVVADPGPRGGTRRGPAPAAVAGVRGPGGQVVFAFAEDPSDRRLGLILEDGRRLDVDLGGASLGWFVKDVDLRGQGRLDYSNLTPLAMFRRRMLILHGPPGSEATLSIGGGPLDAKVPAAGEMPLVAVHRGVTVVILNEAQSLAAIGEGEDLLVGVSEIEPDGGFRLAEGFKEVVRISLDGSVRREKGASRNGRGRGGEGRFGGWEQLELGGLVDGTSPRFATLDGPTSLRACGVAAGHGWYRIRFKQPKTAKVRLDMPQAGDRLRLHLDGRLVGVFGDGLDAGEMPVELSIPAGERVFSILAEHAGRPSDGAGAERRTGVWGPIREVAPVAGVKTSAGSVPPVDPFKLRGFLDGLIKGAPPPEEGLTISWSLRRRSTVVIDLGRWSVPAVVILNGVPMARLAGDGASRATLVVPVEGAHASKVGSNEMLVVPDEGFEIDLRAAAKKVRVLESIREFGGRGEWGFARWASAAEVCELPGWTAVGGGRRDGGNRGGGRPTWFRSRVRMPVGEDLWLDLGSMSRGEAFLDGQSIGRHAARSSAGRSEPTSRLPIPGSLAREEREVILAVFDEEGRPPGSIRFLRGE